jgi:hypothetical protein
MVVDKTDTSVINHETRAAELVSIFKTLANRGNSVIDDAWAKMLNVKKSSFEYYTFLANISYSLDRLVIEIQRSHLKAASKDEYAAAVRSLRPYANIHQLRSLTIDNLKKETDAFRLLTLLDDVLTPVANRKASDTELKEWQDTLRSLIEDAMTAFENETLRNFVTSELSYVLWSIKNYDIIGIEGISRAYGAMAAELARSRGMKGSQTAEARGWYKRAKRPLIALGIAVAASSTVVEQADSLLTHGGHIYETLIGQGDEETSGDTEVA